MKVLSTPMMVINGAIVSIDSLEASLATTCSISGEILRRSLYELNRKNPKLEYNATLISFVVAMLTFSDQSLRAPSQEESKVIKILVELGLPVDISYP